MANADALEQIYESFMQISEQSGGSSEVPNEMTPVLPETLGVLENGTRANGTQGDAVQQTLLVGATQTTASAGGEVLSAMGLFTPLPTGVAASAASAAASGGGSSSIISSVLKSGLGMAPLISGLISLFSGGGSEEPTPLVKYAMPEAIQMDEAVSGSGMSDVVYDQMGLPKVAARSQTIQVSQASTATASNGSTNPTGGLTEAPTQQAQTAAGTTINLTVQALDSQSILDRSQDIARAVRDAMLNMNSINDVINDL